MSLPSITQILQAHCPRPLPPSLPPLIPIGHVYRVTMDPLAHLPSTWRQGIGKVLTNKRIIEYQREGRYGSALVLPPIKGPQCLGCQTTSNTRRYNYEYLPQAGAWCKVCLDGHRVVRDKDRELKKKLKEAFEQEYV